MQAGLDGWGPPLFIVGCGRSGTTMLRLMLDSHPAVAIPWESHFIPAFWKRRKRYLADDTWDVDRLAADIMSSRLFRQWEVPEQPVRRRLERLERRDFGGVVEAVFGGYADHHGKVRWGDKTPIYVLSMPLLARLFPEAKFIHVIRDGRDVALSYLSVAWGPSTLWEAARKWRRDVSAGRRHGASLGPERYLEVRYERLVAEPRRVLELVCDFAGLSFDERMLAFHTHARLQGRPEWRGFHASVTKPVTGGLRDWSTQMPEQQVLAFEAVAGGLLEELGYPRRHEGIPLPWRAGARVRMGVLALKVLGSRAEEALLQAAKRLRG